MERYHHIPLTQVKQGNNVFYLGTINANIFLDIYTVDPVEYNLSKQVALLKSFSGAEDFFEYRIDSTKRAQQDFREHGFQRKADIARARKIAKYLTEDSGLFPNAIVATCELINDYFDLEEVEDKDVEQVLSGDNIPSPLSLLSYQPNGARPSYTIHIPKAKNSIVVIDGQHRVVGLSFTPEEYQRNFDLLVSFIIGVDRSVIAKHFYTINYTQKGVSASLLYHLTGEFNHEIDELTFLHEIVKVLNESDKSPFFQRIKMLGYSDKSLPKDDRKLMTISQSFLIDYLMYSIKDPCPEDGKKMRRPKLPPIFLYYYNNKQGVLILRFIIRFFSAIKDIYGDQWKHPSDSVLSKTPGVGGFLKFMAIFFIILSSQKSFNTNPLKIDDVKMEEMKELLKGIEDVDFSKYNSTSSAGLLNEVSTDLIRCCKWMHKENAYTNYSAMVDQFYSWAVPC